MASLPEGKSQCVRSVHSCVQNTGEEDVLHWALVPKDKRSWFFQGERSAIQLPLDRMFALKSSTLIDIWKPSMPYMYIYRAVLVFLWVAILTHGQNSRRCVLVGTTLCGFVCPHAIKLPSLPNKWCQALLFSYKKRRGEPGIIYRVVTQSYLYVVTCFLSCIHFSTFIRSLFPDDIHADKRGRPTTVGSKIRVISLLLQCGIWTMDVGLWSSGIIIGCPPTRSTLNSH